MNQRDPIIRRLRDVMLFSACTDHELSMLSARMTPRRAGGGEVLTRDGHGGQQFGVIVEGTATVRANGRIIATLGPGDLFGEIAMLDDGPRPATVVAETDLEAQVAGRGEIVELMVSVPNMTRNLLVGLVGRLLAADLQLAA